MEITDSIEEYYELYTGFSHENWGESSLEKVGNVAVATIQTLGNLFLHTANGAIAAKKSIVGDICLSCWFVDPIRSFFTGTQKQ